MSWVDAVDGRLWGLENLSERLAERTCAKAAASGPDDAVGRAVGDLHERVMAVARTLWDTRRLLERKTPGQPGEI